MKNLFLLLCFCTLFACKKQVKEEAALVNKTFVLNTAVASPAMVLNGKPETNYLNITGANSCINNNYTIILNDNGTYTIKAGGALCDMWGGNTGEQKWVKIGDKITLTHSLLPKIVATISADKLVYTLNIPVNGVNHSVVFNFVAK